MDIDKLIEIISLVLENKKNITADSKLKEDLGICSFDMIMIIADIEKNGEFKVNINEFKKEMTIKELRNIIVKL